jgi:hypothetical protein
MTQRFSITILLLVLFGIFGSAQAAGSPWRAWLYEPAVGRMTEVNQDGTTLRTVILPADAGATYSRNAAVSVDGSYVAYASSTPTNMTISIYDLNVGTMFFGYNLPPDAYHSLEFAATPFNFAQDNSTFAFGYAHSSVGWQILVVDLTLLDIFTLSATDPAAVAAGIDPGFGNSVPTVQSNRNSIISFTMVLAAAGGAASYPAYTYDFASNTYTVNTAYEVGFSLDTFPITNEVIFTQADAAFPGSEDPMSGFPVNNTMKVYDPSIGSVLTVLTQPSIYTPRFVQGGERIAFQQLDPTGGSANNLVVMERNGTVLGRVDYTSTFPVGSSAGLLNGLIFTLNGGTGAAGGSTLYWVDTRFGVAPYPAVFVWASPLGADAYIVWTDDHFPAAAGPFLPWASLGSGSTPVVTVAPPAAPGTLTIGGSAQVQTTAGDVLNIRSGPGRSFARVGTVANGTLVTILEGPMAADGLTWWRIRLPTGTEGWVVDFVDGVQTLLPR